MHDNFEAIKAYLHYFYFYVHQKKVLKKFEKNFLFYGEIIFRSQDIPIFVFLSSPLSSLLFIAQYIEETN